MTITDSTFSLESGVSSLGAMTIAGSTFSLDGSAASTSAMTITQSSFSSHAWIATADSDLLTLANSIFYDSAIYAGEGGIYTEDALTIINSTLVKTYLDSQGSVQGGTPPINTTLLGHSAFFDSMILGNGQLTIFSEGALTSTNSTFWGTTIDSAASLHLYNTILAKDSVCGSIVIAGSHDLIDASSANGCGLTNGVNGNIVGPDANLGPLVFISSSSSLLGYFELNPGSPAIDAGDNSI